MRAQATIHSPTKLPAINRGDACMEARDPKEVALVEAVVDATARYRLSATCDMNDKR
jgi:hypothetical protein